MPDVTKESLLAQVNRLLPSSPFVAGRYPYTYAADFIRMFPEIVPLPVRAFFTTMRTEEITRMDASRLRQRWALYINMDEQELAEALADAYLEYQRIERPNVY